MSLQAANTGFNAAPDGGEGLSPIQKAVATVLKDGAAMSDGISLQEVQACFACATAFGATVAHTCRCCWNATEL